MTVQMRSVCFLVVSFWGDNLSRIGIAERHQRPLLHIFQHAVRSNSFFHFLKTDDISQSGANQGSFMLLRKHFCHKCCCCWWTTVHPDFRCVVTAMKLSPKVDQSLCLEVLAEDGRDIGTTGVSCLAGVDFARFSCTCSNRPKAGLALLLCPGTKQLWEFKLTSSTSNFASICLSTALFNARAVCSR